MKRSIFILVILSLFLTGCWDKRELNELAITVAMGIDKVEDGFRVTAQVVVPSEVSTQAGSGRSTITLFQEDGETVYEALRKMTMEAPRKIYPGHLRVLVIGEELAQEGIGESLDLLSRDWEFRSDFYVSVARDRTAAEILNVTTTIENIPANEMFNTLKTSENSWSVSKSITLDKLIGDLISKGKDPVITGIYVTGNKDLGSSKLNVESITPAAKIRYDYLAVFKKDKLVGWLTERESIGFNYITNSVKTTITSVACPDEGKVSIEVIQFKSVMKGTTYKGEPQVDINIKAEGNVGAVECQIDLTELKTMEALEKVYEEEVEEIIKQTIETIQKNYKADIFGFGEAIHRSNPKEWKRLKEQWDEKYSELAVDIKVDMKLRRTGTVKNSFLDSIQD
ncbi:Ger(x)C family spore germination protein [Sporosarcina sp. FSL K6-1508]|uniref:Ger(x)C family spore germination protein n=1 Tax=Sporosarcina sp. FSL K6-1508 TaxID=2921553 RepID=UPI0030FBDFFF